MISTIQLIERDLTFFLLKKCNWRIQYNKVMEILVIYFLDNSASSRNRNAMVFLNDREVFVIQFEIVDIFGTLSLEISLSATLFKSSSCISLAFIFSLGLAVPVWNITVSNSLICSEIRLICCFWFTFKFSDKAHPQTNIMALKNNKKIWIYFKYNAKI